MQVNFEQAVTLIRTVGTQVTVMLRGQPGMGKSAILKELAKQLPDHTPCYVDCTQLDLGDIAMPVVDRETMTTSYAPNNRFGLRRGSDRPVIIMLDELTKAPKPVLNMLWPLINDRRLTDLNTPYGSYVFATGNLDSDGVGDSLPAHGYNRMTVVDYANPEVLDAEGKPTGWLLWAAENDIDPAVMKFVFDTPEVFERYDALTNPKNPYVFNPLTGNTKTYCSGRSLERASHIIKQRDRLGAALLPALAGTIGEPAARMLEAAVLLDDKLPPLKLIESSPKDAPLPDGVSAYFLMAFKLANRAQPASLPAYCEYVKRWESFEARHLFITTIAGVKSKLTMLAMCRAYTELSAGQAKYLKGN